MADIATTLTANELKILAAAWMSCPTTPKPDYDVVAQICGYKNGGVASVMYGGLRRKLEAAKALASGEGAPAAKPRAKANSKRTAEAADGAEAEAQPKKRGRKAKVTSESVEAPKKSTKKTKVKAEAADDVEGTEEDSIETAVKEDDAAVVKDENGDADSEMFNDGTGELEEM